MAKFLPGQSECQNSLKDFRDRYSCDRSTIFKSSQERAVQRVKDSILDPASTMVEPHDSAKKKVEIEICDE